MEALERQLIFAGAALLCACTGSVLDVRGRRIPNCVTGTAIAGGLMLHGLAEGRHGLESSALAGLIAGSIFLLLYVAGGMGGGDVKLMAAVGTIAGPSLTGVVLIATAIAGGLLALGVSLYHGRARETVQNVGVILQHHRTVGLTPHPDLNLANRDVLRIPYALAIAAGCLFAFCKLAWSAPW